MRLRTIAEIAVVFASSSPAWAQTIQLPSFSSFSVNTSVLVPDSGPSPIARDRRAQTSSTTVNGIPRQQGLGLARQAGQVGVTATIHDPRAADERLLGRTTTGRIERAIPKPLEPRPTAPRPGDVGLHSVEALTRQRLDREAAKQRELLELVARARRARDEGKLSVARVHLSSALRQASGELKQRIAAELSLLGSKGTPAATGAR